MKYWIETNKAYSPHITDIDPKKVPVVKVVCSAPPFALGDTVAFFVGKSAKKRANQYVKMMNEAKK